MEKVYRVRLTGLIMFGGIIAAALIVAVGLASSTTVFAEDGATMSLSASGSDVECSGDDCTVAAGATFTITVNADSVPDGGYMLVQSFIDFGTDLTYSPSDDPADEVSWADCDTGVVVRFQFTPETVNHGCLTGLIPPFSLSTYVGPVYEIELTCGEDASTTNVRLLPFGDEVADSSGSVFGTDVAVEVDPKLSSVTITCVEDLPDEPDEPTDGGLPATGSAPLGSGNGGASVGLWIATSMLAIAGAAGIGARGWQQARRRRSQ